MVLRVTRTAIEAMRSHALCADPHECCGLLLGAQEHIDATRECVNMHGEPWHRFEIDPAALIAAHRSAREGGPEVIGYYHSHPAGLPQPSATDRAMAAGDGRVWAIIGLGTLRFWRDLPGGFIALDHTIVAD